MDALERIQTQINFSKKGLLTNESSETCFQSVSKRFIVNECSISINPG